MTFSGVFHRLIISSGLILGFFSLAVTGTQVSLLVSLLTQSKATISHEFYLGEMSTSHAHLDLQDFAASSVRATCRNSLNHSAVMGCISDPQEGEYKQMVDNFVEKAKDQLQFIEDSSTVVSIGNRLD